MGEKETLDVRASYKRVIDVSQGKWLRTGEW